MTPQLRQAIKLLQYSHHEVAAFIEEELERNPLLERDERPELTPELPALDQRQARDDGDGGSDTADLVNGGLLPDPGTAPLDADLTADFETGDAPGAYERDGMQISGSSSGGSRDFDDAEWGVDDLAEGSRSLRDHLGEQLRLGFPDAAERLIGAHLIALLDPSGRLAAEPAAVAAALGTSLEAVESVRARMMRFDPVGVLARDLSECLAVQLAERNRLDPAMAALLDNLELLARRELKRLQLVCGVDAEDLAEMIAEIRALDPKPGAAHDATPPLPIVPDVLMRPAAEGGWMLELNPETMPRLLISQAFHARVLVRAQREEKLFIAEKLANANWLVKSLQQRAQTILRVASEVVRRQDGFMRHGVGHLRPLILRDIADAVEMHESTVSRVTANKYIATPRGTFELKYFFTTAIAGMTGETHSAEAVRYRIRGMIDAETPAMILSDDAIVAALRREGVDIARRTVAKYRDALRIPSSVQRKREKALSA
jgi:RNA polymerase sigma-54 factor